MAEAPKKYWSKNQYKKWCKNGVNFAIGKRQMLWQFCQGVCYLP